MKSDLKDLIIKYMPETLSLGKLHCESIGFDECILSNNSARFLVFRDREGINFSYIKEAKGNLTEYQMGHFLLLRRKVPRFNPVDFQAGEYGEDDGKCVRELIWYERALLSTAADILNGDEKWLQDYPWNPIPVAAPTAALIREIGKGFTPP